MTAQLINQDLYTSHMYAWWSLRMQQQTSHWKPAQPPGGIPGVIATQQLS